jgi:hypothetical protein
MILRRFGFIQLAEVNEEVELPGGMIAEGTYRNCVN